MGFYTNGQIPVSKRTSLYIVSKGMGLCKSNQIHNYRKVELYRATIKV